MFGDSFFLIDFIQLLAVILGITEVLLARANKVWLYPAGICSVTLSMFSLFESKLYAECLLNLYYLVMSIYGWIHWSRRIGKPGVIITMANPKEWLTALGIVAGGWSLLYYLLDNLTTTDVPAWDALVSATGWAGMWLLARRKVENWILLNVSNMFAIPLLWYKDLFLLSGLTVFLFAVACKGYLDWLREAKIVNAKTYV